MGLIPSWLAAIGHVSFLISLIDGKHNAGGLRLTRWRTPPAPQIALSTPVTA